MGFCWRDYFVHQKNLKKRTEDNLCGSHAVPALKEVKRTIESKAL